MSKINLLDMSKEALTEWCASLGEPRFRAVQLIQWIHQMGVSDFSAMTNLSKKFRDVLSEKAEVLLPEIILDKLSDDGTRKWLMKLPDGNSVETVFIPEATRGTLCISSQVGCSLNCTFCATGAQGFNRNLTIGEIIGQVWLARHLLNESRSLTVRDTEARIITNVVFMGMGEPMLNFDNVVVTMNLLMDDVAYGLSKYKVTLSTSGLVPQIDALSTCTEGSLAISLHAPNDELRNVLVPINKKYPLKELLAACRRFFPEDSKRRILFEYVMLKGVNDTPQHARQLAKLLQGVPGKVNLIPFNPFPMTRYTCSDPDVIETFADIVSQSGIITTVRRTRGQDIAAACGQLVGDFRDRTVRSAKYKERYAEDAA